MTLYFLVLIAGLAALIWSADKFVDSAGGLPYRLGLSPLLIGMTVVALGTSAPEAVVAISASIKGSSAMVIGNALGSNIANIALVLGVTALIAPLPVRFSMVKKELPLMLAAVGLAGYGLADSRLNLFDAITMLTLLAFIMWWIFYSDENSHPNLPKIPELGLKASIIWLILSLIVLGFSSHALVWAASNIATMLGVSELLIGLTIVAIGTSLPELAASAISAFKRQHEIAIGNIIGSNIFNSLLVLAIPAIISPGGVPLMAEHRDLPIMLILSLVFALILLWKREGEISQQIGVGLLFFYAFYLFSLYISPSI